MLQQVLVSGLQMISCIALGNLTRSYCQLFLYVYVCRHIWVFEYGIFIALMKKVEIDTDVESSVTLNKFNCDIPVKIKF